MRTLRLIPSPQGGTPVASDDEQSFSYSTDEEAEAVEVDLFESASPIVSRLSSSPKSEDPLLSAVRQAISSENLSKLKTLLADADLVKNINQPRYNAMDFALSALLRDKQNPFILEMVVLLKGKGAVPNVMKADAAFWCNDLIRRAEELVRAAKILSFQNK